MTGTVNLADNIEDTMPVEGVKNFNIPTKQGLHFPGHRNFLEMKELKL